MYVASREGNRCCMISCIPSAIGYPSRGNRTLDPPLVRSRSTVPPGMHPIQAGREMVLLGLLRELELFPREAMHHPRQQLVPRLGCSGLSREGHMPLIGRLVRVAKHVPYHNQKAEHPNSISYEHTGRNHSGSSNQGGCRDLRITLCLTYCNRQWDGRIRRDESMLDRGTKNVRKGRVAHELSSGEMTAGGRNNNVIYVGVAGRFRDAVS